MLIYYKAHIIIIIITPWYSWNIVQLALNNNCSLGNWNQIIMQYRKIPVHEKYMRRKRNTDVCLINVVTWSRFDWKWKLSYGEIYLYQTLSNLESCIDQTLNKVPMLEIIANLACINRTPVYFKHIRWSEGSV